MFRNILSIHLSPRNSTGAHHDRRRGSISALPLVNQPRFLAGGASRRSAVFLLVGLLATVVLLLAPSLAWAEESLKERASRTWERLRGSGTPDQIPDRLQIRGGAGYVFGASTTLTANGPAGIGTTIDFDQTLGGDTEADLARVDAWWRFNSRHSLGFTWYSVDRTGFKTLAQPIIWDGATYTGTVGSAIDIELYRLMYNYSFYHTDKVEIGVSPGIYLADMRIALAGNFTKNGVPVVGGEEDEDLTIPLPSIGLLLNYHITPRFQTQTRGDFFYLQVGEFRGTMVEFYFGLEYRLFKYLGLGVAYDFLAINAENTDTTEGWKINNAWNSVFFYGSLYVFDTPL